MRMSRFKDVLVLGKKHPPRLTVRLTLSRVAHLALCFVEARAHKHGWNPCVPSDLIGFFEK